MNLSQTNVNSAKSGSTKARDLLCRMDVVPDWHTSCPHRQKFTHLRPHSSPCRVCSRNGFPNMFRPSSTTAIANPILSFLDVKRILFQKITDKGDELVKAFQLLDTSHTMTVSKSELRRVVTTFLLPLTREQFHEVLAQIPLTSSGAVPYLEFLSRFGGLDLNINVIKRGSGNEMNGSRTLKELEIQVGEKILKNIKTVISALKLLDVNKTGLVQPHALRRVLETFCLKMKDEEYKKFAQYYGIDKDTAVDYNIFLKNLSINNNLNLRYYMGNHEVSWENQQVKNSRRDCLLSSDLSESSWEDYSLDEIGRTFCQEFSKSREKIEKALSAGDPSQCGYISLNYLKIVLDTFVRRLPRRIFIQLMKRFGLKTTKKVNWKQFLASLHDPQWMMEVDNTVPLAKKISSDSKHQPHQENVITRLFRHRDLHTSLKKALMLIDTKLDGQIKGEELRHIINCMVVKISDSEFRALMRTLDPSGTGLVDVRAFAQLLEDSCLVRKPSPHAEPRTPLLLAQDSVEEMVRDAIGRNVLAFYNMLHSYDLGRSGLMGANNFKKVMHIFCPCLTMEDLTKLCSLFRDTASGRVLYKNLLASIGVHGPPSASPALTPKDRPSRERSQKEELQAPDGSERAKPTEDKGTSVKSVTKEEAIKKLKTCLQQEDPTFQKRFPDFSKELDGKINVRDFRKVLQGHGMPMDNDQYAQLTARVGFKREGMSSLDFATGLEGTKTKGPQVTPPQTATPPKSKVTSDFVSAEECLKLLPERLRESFRDPYAAFFRMDTDRDGIISMHDLRHLLQRLLFNLKDEEFERLLGLLGLRLGVTLNFREFRNLFEKSPLTTDDAPQRLVRTKQKVADSELACEQAHQYLVTKAKTRWSDLSKNFIETDREGAGIVRRRDIKNALYSFDIPLTPREFEKLWMRYDTEGKGHLTYKEFLQKLGIHYSADVHQPYTEDHFNFMGHFTKPQQEPAEVTELLQGTGKAAPARDKLQDHYQDIRKALAKLADPRSGSVSTCQLRQALQDSGCPLRDEELAELLDSWGISWQNNSINYLDFLRAVENSKPPRPEPKQTDSGVPINFAKLHPEEVLRNIQKVVTSSSQALSTAFSALDKEDTGFVKASDFGQVLKDFCYKLTDNQYHYFLRKLRIHLTPHINWKYFLQSFAGFLEETASEWAEKMPKGPPLRSPQEMANHEVLARLHKAVTSHYHAIAQDFENFDTLKTSTVSRDEFRAVCTRHVQVLTDEQFDRLWSGMPADAKGRLKYLDFLSRFNSEKAATPPGTNDSAQAHRGSDGPRVSAVSRSGGSLPTRDLKAGTMPRSQPSTAASTGTVMGTPPLQNCEPVERRLRRTIQGCWREFLKECKERDAHRRGAVTAAEFLALVEKFNLDISEEECQQLVTKYDLKGDGSFAYCDFIQSCVLLLKAKETSLMQRMKIQNAHKMKEAGAETSSFYCALLRIQPKILHCWRPMRRTFKAYDAGGTGLVGVADFRKVLRQYSINLSEEEFFHILEYYDKTLSSKISYNDFLRAFLQ
ncbi:EF-hand calcium-binding domain-containing protein 6 [Pteronotus mesoamericanus]|uniref:EF-hand calcium-binding domain-containing protein 6 n=1 Tax=Pteronotus mesoamericanus TaxID=1884717 RepID=UPI0023EB3C99|nr:EF-hand calcium-binding domain-containing protein 6 [Pteronotus parnellii mesoamericanus]